jgi:hypothetical protein
MINDYSSTITKVTYIFKQHGVMYCQYTVETKRVQGTYSYEWVSASYRACSASLSFLPWKTDSAVVCLFFIRYEVVQRNERTPPTALELMGKVINVSLGCWKKPTHVSSIRPKYLFCMSGVSRPRTKFTLLWPLGRGSFLQTTGFSTE